MNNHLDASTIILGAFPVRRTDVREADLWGAHVRAPILSAGEALDGFSYGTQTSGQTFYRNVLIYEPRLNQEFETSDTGTDEFIADSKKILANLEIILPKITPKERKVLFAGIATALAIEYERDYEEVSRVALEETIVVHEMGHVRDHSDPEYRAAFAPSATTDPLNMYAHIQDAAAHEEINGMLTELRYAPKKRALSLGKIFGFISEGVQQDFEHDRAACWIVDQMINLAQENPERYGVTTPQANTLLTKSEHALLALPMMLARSGDMDHLLDDVKKLHRTPYDSFGEEGIAHFRAMVRSQDQGLPIAQIGLALTAIGGVAFTVKSIYDKYVESKKDSEDIRSLEQDIRTAFGEDHAKEANVILTDFQIGIEEKKVDRAVREKAYTQFVDRCRENPELIKTLSRVKQILGRTD